MINKLTLRLVLLISCLQFGLLTSCRQDKNGHADQDKIEDTWYRNPVIYNLDVDAFKDSNGDGTGDFNGLTQQLDYLKSIGVDIIWLAPFQPTPDKDDGYDVTDYYGMDSRLGTEADFNNFMQQAKQRKMRVIMDLVLNHTSIEHEWYQAARSDSTSKFYSWYVWSGKKPRDWDKGMVFPGVQSETWTYDEIAKKYYFHRFYDFQPDLNYQNKEVVQNAADVLQYWLKKGLDGFRLDAVPFIVDIPETGSEKPEHMFNILTALREKVKAVKPDALLLGEANVTAEENKDYFGDKGERLQMMFNFQVNQSLFYSFAKSDPQPFLKALEDFREKPAAAQWAFFLRNHDEVDLARLSNAQRKQVYEQFGPETNMQLYKRGIRRRLAPMLSDPERLKMAYGLLFSLPGAPVLRYGEEIGMGDDLTLPERLSVRTPMQWSSQLNGGFSTAKSTFRPVIRYGDYGYPTVNVAAELDDKSSLLNFIKSMIQLRKLHPEVGLGNWEILPASAPVAIIHYTYEDKNLIVAFNFSKDEQEFSIDKEITEKYKLIPQIGIARENSKDEDFELKGYGLQWYVLK